MRAALAGAALLVAVVVPLFGSGLGTYALLDPDEARHAEVAREMARGAGVRALFLPTLEFAPYREKPAPFYWLVLAAWRVGGFGEAAARAVSAAAALAVLLMVYAFALRREGPAGALAAALVLATAGGFFGLARFVNFEMTLAAAVVGGVLAGLAWLDGEPRRGRPLAPYLATAAATLVKGPIGAALVVGPLALALAVHPRRPDWRTLGLGRGALVAVVLVGGYWATVALLDSSYALRFVTTHVRRFTGESPHPEPIWYYLVWLPVIALPWTLFAPGPLVRAARDPARRRLVLWAAFVPAVLSLARGKVATYAISALVPMALVLGPELLRTVRDGPPAEDTRLLRAAGWLGVVFLGATTLAAPVARAWLPIPWPGVVVLVAVAGGWTVALAALLRRRGPGPVPAVVLGAALTLFPLGMRIVMPAVAALYSARDAARLIATGPPGPVIAFAARAPSLVFYLGAGVVRTTDLDQVRDLFLAPAAVYVWAGHAHFARMEEALGPRAHLWYGTARRRLWANVPAPAPAQPPNGSR